MNEAMDREKGLDLASKTAKVARQRPGPGGVVASFTVSAQGG